MILQDILEQPPIGHSALQPPGELHSVLHGVAEHIWWHSVDVLEHVLMSQGADVQFVTAA